MRKIFLTILLNISFVCSILAQISLDINDASYEKSNDYVYTLGEGISFNFDDSVHIFRIGGMAQFRYLNMQNNDSLNSAENYRPYLKKIFSKFN